MLGLTYQMYCNTAVEDMFEGWRAQMSWLLLIQFEYSENQVFHIDFGITLTFDIDLDRIGGSNVVHIGREILN